ncbi:MAG: penicillin-binding transpeptidase domain-containing protein [Gemmatimonadaceae bacterium]
MIRSSRIGLAHLSLFAFALALVGKAAKVQLVDGGTWSRRAARQQLAERTLPAPRGEIQDAGGQVLAQTREVVRLEVAPREVRDMRRFRRTLDAAGIDPRWIARATDTARAWVTIPGTFLAAEVAPLLQLRGVHWTPMMERVYPVSEGTRRIVGRVDAQGSALDGIELALDSVLRGRAGTEALVRDARGRSFESPQADSVAPTPGYTVRLTVNHELQEIADRALADAVAKMGAEGGDVVILDPHTGAIRAMASRRLDPRSTAATALTEPFEPGSTLKPFTAAGLLALGRVRDGEVVDVHGGQFTVNGRTITDVHRSTTPLTLHDVLRWSSNVGIVRFAERLQPREQYEILRDFGFGMPTGLPYPSEAGGRLREPRDWSKQSPASLAMGYEIAVTPLQLALGYAVFANGGELLEPAIVQEVRAPDGSVVYRHQPRVVRRVVPPAVAERVRRMLADVVTEGTALQADLSTFMLAGKTGTARRTVNGRYVAGQYYATFVGLFPAEEPQFVILVKLDSPSGSYYGGTTAAPVTRAVLEAALAARDAALDHGALNTQRHARSAPPAPGAVQLAGAGAEPPAASPAPVPVPPAVTARDGSVPFIASLPYSAPAPAPPLPPRPVPDVTGLTVRDAVRALHGAGFRVRLATGGAGTTPAAGVLAPPGAVVRLSYQP